MAALPATKSRPERLYGGASSPRSGVNGLLGTCRWRTTPDRSMIALTRCSSTAKIRYRVRTPDNTVNHGSVSANHTSFVMLMSGPRPVRIMSLTKLG